MIIASAASCCDGFLSRVKERCAAEGSSCSHLVAEQSGQNEFQMCGGEGVGNLGNAYKPQLEGEEEGIVKLSKCSRQVGGLNAS